MWIPRDIEPRLERSARTRPVVVLTGARQTGKTPTFRRLFPKHEFVSLDLPTEAEQAEKEPESFLRQHPAPAIIDEVQYAPGLFRYLKIAVDAGRSYHGRFLLTCCTARRTVSSFFPILPAGSLRRARSRACRIHSASDMCRDRATRWGRPVFRILQNHLQPQLICESA